VTTNMFGDIITDLGAAICGGMGVAASGNLNPDHGAPGNGGGPSMFEPVHGSAPDIAGQGIANPLAMFLSAAMMLRHGFGLETEAAAVESAVDRALADGLRTPDLGGGATTAQATQGVLKHL
jgi:3-isopropylmalate dehydrogenase